MSQRFGGASSLLAVEGSLGGVRELAPDLYFLRRDGVLTETQFTRLRGLLGDGVSPQFPDCESVNLLAEIEGLILGRLVRQGGLPEDETARLRGLLSGRGEIDVPGIVDAHRRIRAPWIVSFLRERGVRPFGAPHHVRRTRLERFSPLSELAGRPVYLKHEDEQPVGSFKNRGATNFLVAALLAGYDPHTLKVGTASHGNHAQGAVQAARNLGIRNVEVLLPKNASPLKIAQLETLGAKVELFGDTFEECADEVANRAAKDANYLFLPAFDQPLVVMGQGTIGLEISLQMAIHGYHKDYGVIVPAGGGGLIAGIATYLNRDHVAGVAVVGVESKAHPYVSRSFNLKKVVVPEEIKHYDTVADGIALLRIGEAGFQNVLNYARGVQVVPERLIEAALAYLQENGLTLEGAAATPVAGLVFGALDLESYGISQDQPVVLVASGRNIDPALLTRMTAEHGEGRWRRLREQFDRLRARLATAGYLAGGSVRSLETPEEGIAFVDCVLANLPEGWDLVDAFELLDFGPWKEKKDINGSLRSFGQYHQRWNHSKEEALTHPESNRGQQLELSLRGLSDGAPASEILKEFPLLTLHRLQVETHVMDVYLNRPDWIERLRPDMTPAEREGHFGRYRVRNEGIKESIKKFIERLENR
ncbi:MAG TPA: pyridoxal-phosphate dependent enzyme [bacterium]|nr:pyridoxal-phosphate dependent enzyme [bacterium]